MPLFARYNLVAMLVLPECTQLQSSTLCVSAVCVSALIGLFYLVSTSTWLSSWSLCQSPGMQFSVRSTLLYTQVLTAVLKSLGFALGEGSSADQYVDACFECYSSEQNQAAIWVDDVAQYAARVGASVNSCTPEQVPTVPTVSVTVHPLTVHPLTVSLLCVSGCFVHSESLAC